MKLLQCSIEHLGCHWIGSQWAFHQDSCNDFTTLLYSGSNHNRGRSHTAGNCCKVTRTSQRPPIIKGDDGPKRDTVSLQIFARTQHRSYPFRQGHLDIDKMCGHRPHEGHHPLYLNGKRQFFYSCIKNVIGKWAYVALFRMFSYFLLAILSFLLPKDLINWANVKWRDEDFNITNVHSD